MNLDDRIYFADNGPIDEVVRAVTERARWEDFEEDAANLKIRICILVKHAAGIALKPIYYLAFAIASFANAAFIRWQGDRVAANLQAKEGLKFLACILTAPFAELILTIKALFALFRPEAYFALDQDEEVIPVEEIILDSDINTYCTRLASIAEMAGCNPALVNKLRDGDRLIAGKLVYYQAGQREQFAMLYKHSLTIIFNKLQNADPEIVKLKLNMLNPIPHSPEPSGIDACAPGFARLLVQIRNNLNLPDEQEKIIPYLAAQYKEAVINDMVTQGKGQVRSIIERLTDDSHHTNQVNGLILLLGSDIRLSEETIKEAQDRYAHPERISVQEKQILLEEFKKLYASGLENYLLNRINGGLEDTEGLKEFRLHMFKTLYEKIGSEKTDEVLSKELEAIEKEMQEEMLSRTEEKTPFVDPAIYIQRLYMINPKEPKSTEFNIAGIKAFSETLGRDNPLAQFST